MRSAMNSIGLGIVFLWFFGGGIGHFVDSRFFIHIMPSWMPWQLELVYISGVFELLGAVGILIPKLRLWAGNGLILLTLVVTPVNVHMWLHPELFPEVPELFLTIRLVVQVMLLATIWMCMRKPKEKNNLQIADKRMV